MFLDSLVFKAKTDFNSLHGFSHWRSVYKNGLKISQDVDKTVLFYFSVFHDFFRVNEYTDSEHGKRASEIISKQALDLTDSQMEVLSFALTHHDLEPEEYNELKDPLKDDINVRTCIDSDRLDLGRVGIQPLVEYMLTDGAKRILNS